MWYKTKEPKMVGSSKGGKGKRSADDWDDWDAEEELGTSGDVNEEGIITELDVLYGDGQPWFGFERVLNGPVISAQGKRWETVDVVVRRGNPGQFVGLDTGGVKPLSRRYQPDSPGVRRTTSVLSERWDEDHAE